MVSSEYSTALVSSPREMIMGVIVLSPGLHFREIQRKVRMVNGALQHHLDVLSRRGALKSLRQGRYLRFFPIWFDEAGMNLTGLLRHGTMRKISLYLLERPGASLKDISEHLALSISTVQWHLRRMEDLGAMTSLNEGRERGYHLKDMEEVSNALRSMEITFRDRLTHNFIDLWEF